MQSAPQLMPTGDEVTVPRPVPFFTAVSVNWRSKFAVTVCAEFSVTVQGAVPEQPPPDQPVNMPVVAVAVSVTIEPSAYCSVQSAPQLMPAGFDVTVPVPVPVL